MKINKFSLLNCVKSLDRHRTGRSCRSEFEWSGFPVRQALRLPFGSHCLKSRLVLILILPPPLSTSCRPDAGDPGGRRSYAIRPNPHRHAVAHPDPRRFGPDCLDLAVPVLIGPGRIGSQMISKKKHRSECGRAFPASECELLVKREVTSASDGRFNAMRPSSLLPPTKYPRWLGAPPPMPPAAGPPCKRPCRQFRAATEYNNQ
jgi:hypothetical protein